MPQKRIPMGKILDTLRLKFESNFSHNKIARTLQISKGAVAKYLQLFIALKLSWPLPDEVDEAALDALFFPSRTHSTVFVEPDCPDIYHQLKRKGVTLQLLWSEYSAKEPSRSYRYSQYCSRYREWRARQKRSMRQTHYAGDKLFIDYCGPTMPINDSSSGEILQAQIFVAVMGASNYTYAEATRSQQLHDWIDSHQRAFRFFGGVTELLVPDNLRSGIKKPCRYEPKPNDTYMEMARHYNTAILPARPLKPQDKSLAEIGVQIVERWIMARLRHHTFFSLAELNVKITELLTDLNNRPFQKLPGCRQTAFETLDKPVLKPLPNSAYEFAQWTKYKVKSDYHVEVQKHFYSVPDRWVGHLLDVRASAATIEAFHKGKRIASHPRARQGGYTTLSEHLPESHRKQAQWTPEKAHDWAKSIGLATQEVMMRRLTNRPHPEHGYRSYLGLLKLSRRYSPTRLEAACERALFIHAPTYESIASILKQGLDQQSLHKESDEQLPKHANVRGSSYYH